MKGLLMEKSGSSSTESPLATLTDAAGLLVSNGVIYATKAGDFNTLYKWDAQTGLWQTVVFGKGYLTLKLLCFL